VKFGRGEGTDTVTRTVPSRAAEGGRGAADDAPTRQRVAASILQNGPSTVSALAERLALTPTAVRRHLDHLLATGAVEAREQRIYGSRGRGRPAKVFALTDSGRDTFVHAYDDLALGLLQFLDEAAGPDAVAAFARRRTGQLAERYESRMAAATVEERTIALAEALDADGYAASVTATATGDQICQHHCPVAHVAARYPQLCEAETEVFSRLLGRHVQRLATIAHGDGVCTTNVPHPTSASRNESNSRDPVTRGGLPESSPIAPRQPGRTAT
jgi:predicted ArsR family transcriptional regulator